MPVYVSIIGGMLLYINTVSIMKKIKKGEDTNLNTLVGAILVGAIIFSIFVIYG